MEAENKKARLKAKLRFTLVFAIALIVTTTGGIVTIVTAQKGISLLESKKAEYDNVFKKQAELNFQIEELFRDLNNLKTKRRNSSEHKHMQKLITKKRLLMEMTLQCRPIKASTKCIKLCLNRSVSSNHQWMTLTAKAKSVKATWSNLKSVESNIRN